MSLEIQYFEDCPNSKEFIKRVKRALEETKVKHNYKETVVDSYECAQEIRFRGSPTLLINGNDLQNMEAPESPGLNCRYSKNGLPSIDEIKAKFEYIVQNFT